MNNLKLLALSLLMISQTQASSLSEDYSKSRNHIHSLSSQPINEAINLDIKTIPHETTKELQELYERANKSKEYLNKYSLEKVKKNEVENKVHNAGDAESHNSKLSTIISDSEKGITDSLKIEMNSKKTSGKDKIFCSDGTCTERKETKGSGFEEAASELEAASGAAKDVNKEKNETEAKATRVFSGHVAQCHSRALGYLDCCSDKGWGKDLNLSKCSSEDKKLGEAKIGYKAHYIGIYCAKWARWIGGKTCKKRIRTYCMFPSKLARIIREQGAFTTPKLSFDFGTAEHPNCAGFLPSEFEKVNLSKINFKNPIYPFDVNNHKYNDASSSNAAGISADINKKDVDKKKLEEKAKETSKRKIQGKPEGVSS
mgnify:CR=1 FL=1